MYIFRSFRMEEVTDRVFVLVLSPQWAQQKQSLSSSVSLLGGPPAVWLRRGALILLGVSMQGYPRRRNQKIMPVVFFSLSSDIWNALVSD